MTITLFSYVTALGPNLPASFMTTGGTEPYIYSVLPDGAGGTIDSDTGVYISPAIIPDSPTKQYDTIQVIDDDLNTDTKKILVGTPLLLFCDIIKNQMELADSHIYVWNQKLIEPKDYKLYIAVSVLTPKIFANTNKWDAENQQTIQSTNNADKLQIDVISRGPEARDKKNYVLMALNSQYSQRQQELNSFYIGKIPAGSQFNNLSAIDGAAIPYRFNISINLQYFEKKVQSVDYYDTFDLEVITDP